MAFLFQNKPYCMKIAWITGTNGLIGAQLVGLGPQAAPAWSVKPITRANVDLSDFTAVERQFRADQPGLIIHCAAITAVADAQKNPALARHINLDLTALLAGLAVDIPFVFFSTDIVFDGKKGDYTETDPVNPLHVYGETKAAAEQAVLKNPRHLVIRTSINGGSTPSGNRAFNEQLRHSLQNAGEGMKLFTDEYRCPIPAVETARATWDLVGKNCTGLYHVAGAQKLSRWEIGQLLVQRWPGLEGRIQPGSARDFPGPPRALDTSLNIAKVQGVLTKPLPSLADWLAAHPAGAF